jgi:DNA mismatch endonuclease (patch repair protein)
MDRITAEKRSANMRAIRSKDTAPEMIVRRLVHSLGYRYRLHQKYLAGRPDLVFPGRRKVIFVHGCFWHQHLGCREGRLPKTNPGYWAPKLERNQRRDLSNLEQLTSGGWTALVIWECETKDVVTLAIKVTAFLGPVLAQARKAKNGIGKSENQR